MKYEDLPQDRPCRYTKQSIGSPEVGLGVLIFMILILVFIFGGH